MLVVDGDRLRAVDLLDLVDQVQLLDAEDRQDVVRIDRTVDQRRGGSGKKRRISGRKKWERVTPKQ